MGRNAQKWLENDYPKEGIYRGGWSNLHNYEKNRSQVEKIDIWAWNKLEGSLKLEGFDNLRELICWGNNLTELDLTGAPNLRKIDCKMNKLRTLNIINLTKLEDLDCCSNQLTELDIEGCFNLNSIKIDNPNILLNDNGKYQKKLSQIELYRQNKEIIRSEIIKEINDHLEYEECSLYDDYYLY